jgi:hypothetical protein
MGQYQPLPPGWEGHISWRKRAWRVLGTIVPLLGLVALVAFWVGVIALFRWIGWG